MRKHIFLLFFFTITAFMQVYGSNDFHIPSYSNFSYNDNYRYGFRTGGGSNHFGSIHTDLTNGSGTRDGWGFDRNSAKFGQLSGADVFASGPLFLSVAICNEFNISFYKDQTVAQNFAQLTDEQQDKILQHHGLYESENFLNMIKHLPRYSDYIKSIYQEYSKLGWWKSKRKGLPSNIKKLYEQVRCQAKHQYKIAQEEQCKKNQERQRLAKILAQEKKIDQKRRQRLIISIRLMLSKKIH